MAQLPITNAVGPVPHDTTVFEDTEKRPTEEQLAKETRKKQLRQFMTAVDLCKSYRNKLGRNWTINIDYRRGKPFASQTDDDMVAVNLDWGLTKTKAAALFSQLPKVRVSHPPESIDAGPWVSAFERKLNDTAQVAGIEAAMDECMSDTINAAGFSAVITSYEAITVDKEVPAQDMSTLPPQMQEIVMRTGKMPDGSEIEMTTVPDVVDKRYVVQRISPADFLWPVDFSGSDFNNAPWLGRSGRLPWTEAKNRFGLKEEDKDKYLGEETSTVDRLTYDADKERGLEEEKVGFDELFYKSFQYDEGIKSYGEIHHLVFMHGGSAPTDSPVIDEPWKGQQIDEETGALIGALRNPIQVLTLAYITDEAIPPSDSAIGRSQVNELNKGRTNIIKQRERSIPVRWYDVNRVDPAIQQALLRGTWQHMLPIQGDGSKVMGELGGAQMPQESFMFDNVAKADLEEQWSVGQSNTGIGVETSGEAEVIDRNFNTKISRERAKVASFFVKIAQVLGGLLCIYEDAQAFGEGFNPLFSRTLLYSTLPDATILIDAQDRLERLDHYIDKYASSGYIDVQPILKEIATLIGLDPNTVVKPRDPVPPAEPNLSLRLTGAEDILNPLVLAILIESGQAPKPETVDQAKKLIQMAVIPQQLEQDANIERGPALAGSEGVGGPGGPKGAEGSIPGVQGDPGGPPVAIGEAEPQMAALPAVSDGTQGGGNQ